MKRNAAGRQAKWSAAGLRLPYIALVLLSGCEGLGWRPVPPEPAPPPKPALPDDPVATGTIGSQTLPANVGIQPLRGFGLVVGLNGRGSSDCPSVIRDYLVELLAKERGMGPQKKGPTPSPAELIDSLDTAVVEVVGVVPAGARRGMRFDLHVRALPGTSTQSLEGGLLLPTPMRYFDRAASGQGLVAGGVLAEASGPVFTGPFEGDRPPPPSPGINAGALPTRGYILGGGRATEDRPTRLMLPRPNYQLAQSIERRINDRFGHLPKAAEALSAGYVDLFTPPSLTRQPNRFRELVAQLLVDNRPAAEEQWLGDLARWAAAGGADRERIAASWEAIGRGVIPHLQPFYTHADAHLRFYAARSGLRLGDLAALPVMGAIAGSGDHSYRLLAVRELGDCDSPQAALHLAPLLDDPDQEVRIAAYEALLQRGHPTIRSVTFRHILDQSQINFILDTVDSDGPPIIYIRRSRLPRIAVFGRHLSVNPPVFYACPDDTVTIHTVDGSEDIRLFAKRRGRMSEQILSPPRVVDLITALGELPVRDEADRLRGLGLPYSQVVQILKACCENETIPARLVLEQTSLTDLLGPEVTPERPEGEPAPAPGEPTQRSE